jgi:hypothetical protein
MNINEVIPLNSFYRVAFLYSPSAGQFFIKIETREGRTAMMRQVMSEC